MNPALSASLHEGIQSLYKDNDLTDVVIRVNTQTFPCHRLVLAAVSPYFRSMFTNDFKDKEMDEVVLHDVKPEIFQSILQYIYFSDESVINDTNVQDIFTTASLFLMRHVMHICENFMSGKICVENAINVWRFAESLSCKTLSQLAKDFILREFVSIAKEDEFLELKTSEIIEIIRDQNLNVEKEEIVGDAVFRWLSADEEARKHNLYDVLQHVRLPLAKSEYIFSLSKIYPFLYQNLELVKLLDEAKYFHCQKTNPNSFSSERFMYRNSNENVNGLICIMGNFVKLYSFQDQKWTTASYLPFDPGHLFASCVHGNNMYVSGGFKNQKCEMLKFKVRENRWISLKALGKLRYRHSVVADSEMIYLVGGSYEDEHFLSDITEYNRSQETYRHIGHLNTPVRSMDTVLVEQYIYVFGGKHVEETGGSKFIQCFDLSTKQGSKLTSEFAVNVIHTGATVIQGSVFLVGGDGHLMKWKYDNLHQSHACNIPRSKDNTLLNMLKVSMCYFDGHLYICTGTTKEIHVVNVETDKQEMMNCDERLMTSTNAYAIGTLCLPRKYFK